MLMAFGALFLALVLAIKTLRARMRLMLSPPTVLPDLFLIYQVLIQNLAR
jgi:hypothetical protein